MVDPRLNQLRNMQATTQGEELFGEYTLVHPHRSPRLAPIRRVAILTEAFLPKVDGVTKTAYLTLRYLQETGREVLVFAPDISVEAVGESTVIPLPSVGVPQAPETRVALPTTIVARKLHTFRPDLIHLFSPAVMSVHGMAIARHMGIPVIANYQTDLPGYARQYGYPAMENPIRQWLRYIHNGCHLTLAPSRSVMRELHQAGFHRLHLWKRGVNIERFHPSKRSQKMRKHLLNGRDENSFVVIYVGRLANEKRVDLLLEVAQLPNVALTIIGDGKKRPELEALFAGTNTYFTGYIYGDTLAEAFASADCFVFTGENETFGQVVQEAMASGLPSVVVNRGGVPDLIDHERTGLLSEPTTDAFARAILWYQNHPEKTKFIGYNARVQARQYPWYAIMEQLESYYWKACWINNRFNRIFHKTTYHIPFPVPRWVVRRDS